MTLSNEVVLGRSFLFLGEIVTKTRRLRSSSSIGQLIGYEMVSLEHVMSETWCPCPGKPEYVLRMYPVWSKNLNEEHSLAQGI